MEVEKDLEIPFKQTLPVMESEGQIKGKCLDILAYLTSEFYGLDIYMEEKAVALALACERFVFGG